MMKTLIFLLPCDGSNTLFTHNGGSKPPPYAISEHPLHP